MKGSSRQVHTWICAFRSYANAWIATRQVVRSVRIHEASLQ